MPSKPAPVEEESNSMPIIVGSMSVVIILAGLAICYRNNNKGEETEGGEYFEGGSARTTMKTNCIQQELDERFY